MALKIELKGTSPGFADLAISGGAGDTGPIEITIQRNQDEHFLAQGGTWQATPFWHSITSVVASPDGILASVGPEIVDPIVACTGMAFLAQVRSAGINGQQVVKLTGRLLGSGAAGPGQSDSPPTPPSPVPTPEPVDTPEPVETREPQAEPVPPSPPPATPETGGSKAGLWVGLVLLLLLLAAAAAWYLDLFGGPAEPVIETEAVVDPVTDAPGLGHSETEQAVQTDPTERAEPPAQPALSGRARAQAFLRASPPPTPDSMLTTALEWEKAGDCEAAIIVFNSAATVDASASKALAERYDPASFNQDGCIEVADAETAVYWYEQPADQGDQAAQSRLGLLLTEDNSSGPLYERGLDYLRKAAESGDPAAAERLRKLGEGP